MADKKTAQEHRDDAIKHLREAQVSVRNAQVSIVMVINEQLSPEFKVKNAELDAQYVRLSALAGDIEMALLQIGAR